MPPAPNLNSSDFYQILGCDRNADESQLKKAYKKLAVKWHPDKNPDNPEATKNFQKISEAYATLSDPKKRKLYDQYGTQGVDAADHMPENGAGFGGASPFGAPGGMPFHFSTSTGGGRPGGGGGMHHMSPDEAQQFFASFFGHDDPFGGFGSMRGPPPRGSMNGNRGMGNSQDPFGLFSDLGGGRPGMHSSMGGMPGMHMNMGGMPGGFQQQQWQSQPQIRRPEKRYDAIPPDTIVSFKGLVSRPEMNGDRGLVQSYDPVTGRYTVIVEDTDEPLRVKPSNLLQHVHVTVHGLESQPYLNGQKGTVMAWNEQKERYNIYLMDQSKVASLKPANVILEKGAVGQIVGLASKPELNGKYGTIQGYNAETNRYDVRMSENQIIRVKLENVRV